MENETKDAHDLDGYIDFDTGVVDVRLGGPGGSRDASRDRQALAARLLHGQPFGFTREDVHAIRSAADSIDSEWNVGARSDFPLVVHLDALADRIEALLPPE